MLLRICPKIEKRETISNVEIRREDLEWMIDSFKARGLPVIVSDRESEFIDIDDIILKCGSSPDEIELYSYSEEHGSISVLFKNGDAWLYAMGSEVAKELYYVLAELITKRRNWKKHLCRSHIWFIFSFSALAVEFLLVFLEPIRSDIPWFSHLCLWLVMVLWPVSRVYLRYLPMMKLEAHKVIIKGKK